MAKLNRDTKLLLEVINTLEKEKINYCISHFDEPFPEMITSDVDVIIDPKELLRLVRILYENGLIQWFQHASEAHLFSLAKECSGEFIPFLQFDTYLDFRQFGHLVLQSSDFLDHKRRVNDLFWAPPIEVEFLYCLIKRLGKEKLQWDHISHLQKLFIQAPENCYASLREFFPLSVAERLRVASETGEWSNIDLHELKIQFMEKVSFRYFWDYVNNRLLEVVRRIIRIFYPTGLWVVFLGPDGCGKSAVLQQVINDLCLGFRRKKSFHFRPGILWKSKNLSNEVICNPHKQNMRGRTVSVIKTVACYLDWLVGYLFDIYPSLVQSTLVVVDRYFIDLAVDPVRYRSSCPSWFVRLLTKILPKPDLTFYLNVSPEVAISRKQELSFEELEFLQQAYIAAYQSDDRKAYLIDANQDFDRVVENVEQHIIAYLKKRTSGRISNC